MDYGNNKVTQHLLKVSESSECLSRTLHGRRGENKDFVGNQKIIRNKRPIRPRTIKDYKNQNIVTQIARNNSRCFKVELCKRDCRYTTTKNNSFFPRTARDWNNLDESAVFAESIEEFKDPLLDSRPNLLREQTVYSRFFFFFFFFFF